MKKKILCLVLALLMVMTICSCQKEEAKDETPANIMVLAGPTGIGAVNLWAQADEDDSVNFNFTLAGANDQVVAAISNGEVDIACVATNLASTLYNKTEGKISVLAINTKGVLYMISKSDVNSFEDLKGKTIYSPGQGANPEYILRYVLTGNNVDPDNDVTIKFVSEGSELASIWANEPDAVLLAPQPVCTSILMQNEGSKIVFDMTEEWAKVSGDDNLVMGCVIVRNDFLNEHPQVVEKFMELYEASINKANEDVDTTAGLCESFGIIPKAALAKKAIPYCSLTYIDGENMKTALSAYLEVMFNFKPQSVGGKLPADDFYYVAK